MGRCLRMLRRYWRQVVVVMTPAVLIFLLLMSPGDERLSCAFVLILMGVYWSTEAVPLAVTGYVPGVLLPMLGLLTTGQVVAEYTKNITLMQLGSMTVAVTFEKCNLHKRIALKVMRTIGTEPKWLLLGFMLPSWFLSMWISNTSTTALMLPLALSVIEELRKHRSNQQKYIRAESGMSSLDSQQSVTVSFSGTSQETDLTVSSLENQTTVNVIIPETGGGRDESLDTLAKGLVIGIAYSSNVGGIATLTGTGPNMILYEFADQIWRSHGMEPPVNYSSWILIGAPLAVINLIILWLTLIFCFHKPRCRKIRHGKVASQKGEEPEDVTKRFLDHEYKKLGPITFAEGTTLFLFSTMILLWFFRRPDFMTGWTSGLKKGYVGSSVPALMVAFIMFVIPYHAPWKQQQTDKVDTLMDWGTFNSKMPWNIIIILGGGFAMAKGVQESGLGGWLGDILTSGPAVPDWCMVIFISLLASGVTEVVSNAASCTLLMPIMANMAESMGMSPLYLMFPAAVSTSFSFMLPVATAPNTLAYTTGLVSIPDMIKTGFVLNLLCTLTVTVAVQTWGMTYFSLNVLPWGHNITTEGSPINHVL